MINITSFPRAICNIRFALWTVAGLTQEAIIALVLSNLYLIWYNSSIKPFYPVAYLDCETNDDAFALPISSGLF